MNKDEIKVYLKDNPELIVDILEELGCLKIKIIPNKRVQSTQSNNDEKHDNPTSVQVKLNDSLSTIVHTNNEFENQEIKDIFTLIQFVKSYTFTEAINFVCNICKIEFKGAVKKGKKSNSYEFLKQFKRSVNKNINTYEETIYDESFKERFIRKDCKLFYDDGVYSETQDKFGVSYDILDNRIVFPIRNYEGKIVSFKGRINSEDYKINGIPKFIYYYPIDSRQYLYGYYENYYDIMLSEDVIVGESEKFVQQLDSMDIHNALSISKKVISEEQLNKLIRLHKDIVLAFDKDVTLENIFIECRKFKGLCNVYYIYDKDNLLKGKESPTDRGLDIFNRLYAGYKFKYKGE